MVVLQNTTGPEGPGTLADSLARLVLGPGERAEGREYEGDLRELTGRYTGPSRGGITDLRIEVDDGELLARVASQDQEDADRLHHISGLTWGHGEDRYTFVRAGTQVIELRLDVVTGHYVLRRAAPANPQGALEEFEVVVQGEEVAAPARQVLPTPPRR